MGQGAGVPSSDSMPSRSWPKVIRDPVHNLIAFENTEMDRLLLRLIDCREFQRLRRIKQMGLSEMVFPGANHSRLAHSIGTMHIARSFIERINRSADTHLSDEQRTVVLASALLHDIGHGPFSHAFEKITGDSHERRTEEIITSDSTEVNRILRESRPNMPDRVARFFQKDSIVAGSDDAFLPALCVHIVSSQLDADRFDYLLRDSYAIGADYGKFDLRWLIDHMHVDNVHSRIYLDRKALYAAEQYIFARYHMYQAVYFHKTTRSAEVMLRLLFRRYKELLREEKTSEKKARVVENAPPALVKAFAGALDLDEYLLLDDHTVTEFLRRCEACDDPILKRLAGGLLHRHLFKCVDATGIPPDKLAEFPERAKAIVKKHIGGDDYNLASDTASDTPYKVYDPSDDNPETQIFVEDRSGRIKSIDWLSDRVNISREKITFHRYYFPEKVRTEMQKLTKSWKEDSQE